MQAQSPARSSTNLAPSVMSARWNTARAQRPLSAWKVAPSHLSTEWTTMWTQCCQYRLLSLVWAPRTQTSACHPAPLQFPYPTQLPSCRMPLLATWVWIWWPVCPVLWNCDFESHLLMELKCRKATIYMSVYCCSRPLTRASPCYAATTCSQASTLTQYPSPAQTLL